MIPRDTFTRLDLAHRDRSYTVCVPARNEQATIAAMVTPLVELRDEGLIDEVLVLGGDSDDDTDRLARQAGATVCDVSTVHAELGPVLGKGDAMWRGLSAVESAVVVFVDADLRVDVERLVCGLAGPLVVGPSHRDASIRFVKGAFRRRHPDFVADDDPYDGGRVTETVARPLINLLRPDLAGFSQPLGGQIAAETALLRSIPMLTGYAVEIGMLIDLVDRIGTEGIAEADLGELVNRPRTTSEIAPMAQEVLYGFLQRVVPEAVASGWKSYQHPRFADGRAPGGSTIVLRPPHDGSGSIG